MEPRKELNDSRPGSPQSDDSSSESDLSSPSFNRDSDFESRTRDVIEAEPSRNSILAMAIEGSFENESDTNSTATAKTILPSSVEAENHDKKNRVPQKPV